MANQIKHENIIQLIESFVEEISDEISCFTIITTEVNESLAKYIQHSKSKLVELVSSEIEIFFF